MRKLIAIISLIFSTATSALAQTQPPATPAPSASCTPAHNEDGAKSNEPIGEKLADSKGVICPPPTNDRGVQAPPESGAKMPVIKPSPDAK
jgi:hypothetical protein